MFPYEAYVEDVLPSPGGKPGGARTGGDPVHDEDQIPGRESCPRPSPNGPPGPKMPRSVPGGGGCGTKLGGGNMFGGINGDEKAFHWGGEGSCHCGGGGCCGGFCHCGGGGGALGGAGGAAAYHCCGVFDC